MQTNFNCKAVEVTEKVRVRQNKNLLAKVKKNRRAIIAAWNCDAAINKHSRQIAGIAAKE